MNRRKKIAPRKKDELQGLEDSYDIVARVNRGMEHLRKQNLEGKIGIVDTPASKEDDPLYVTRMKIPSVEEAIRLGFRARTSQEARFLRSRWKRMLGTH